MIIDRYLATEMARPLGISGLLLVGVFAGYSCAVYMADAADGLLQLSTVARLIMLKTVIALEILLPTGLYFSVLSAIGRLHRDSEMTALRAAGIGDLRILSSVFKFALVVAVLVGLLSLYGRPWAYRESYRLEDEAAAQFDISNLKADQFLELRNTQYVLFAREIDADHNRLREVFLKSSQGDTNRVIFAKEAYLPPVRPGVQRSAQFIDGYGYWLDRQGRKDITLRFKTLVIHLQEQQAEADYKRKAEPTSSLAKSGQLNDIAEYQWRLSTPLGTVLLALLAVPLSASKPRQSRFGRVFTAIVTYVLWYNAVNVVRNMVEQGRIDAIPGLWLAYIIPAALLAALVVKPRLKRRAG